MMGSYGEEVVGEIASLAETHLSVAGKHVLVIGKPRPIKSNQLDLSRTFLAKEMSSFVE